MKDLMERYLAAVERRLPKAQSKDIIAELREAVGSKVEAKEEALGRAANADEIALILKGFGHPVVVASRYSGREYMIGPNLYPWFWDAQRTGLGVVFAIVVAIASVRAFASERPMQAVIQGIGGAIEACIWMFGVITVVFVVLEQTKTDVRIAQRWNPKALPHDNIRKPRGLFETMVALAFDAIFILWWTKVVRLPDQWPMQDSDGVDVHLSAAWAPLHAPILVLALLVAAVHVADIVRPAWSRLRSLVSIAGHIAGLAVLWILYRAGPLVDVTGIAGAEARAERLQHTLDMVFGVGMLAAALMGGVALGVEIWRLLLAARSHTPPPIPGSAA